MKEKLTKEIAYKNLQSFFEKHSNPIVIFGSGMSCSVNKEFGMNALEKELKNKLYELGGAQKKEWESVLKSLDGGNDFENSMNNIKDKKLLEKIVKITGDFIADIDKKNSIEILTGEKKWPATSLFKKLVNGLSENDCTLHVVTTNYDTLAENAFDYANILYIDGFAGGINRKLDWKQSERCITYKAKISSGKKIKELIKKKKHVNLYKVHGSLNFFTNKDIIIENNAWMYNNKLPENQERLIITPGISKYEKLLEYRDKLLKPFDKAVNNNDSFIFLGFGFNDQQLISNEMKPKLINSKCDGLIITRDMNKRIEKLLKKAENLWLICKSDENKGTIIINKKYENKLFINDEDLWEIDNFTKKILGES